MQTSGGVLGPGTLEGLVQGHAGGGGCMFLAFANRYQSNLGKILLEM